MRGAANARARLKKYRLLLSPPRLVQVLQRHPELIAQLDESAGERVARRRRRRPWGELLDEEPFLASVPAGAALPSRSAP